MNIGATIRAIRKQRKMTIPQLCECTGLSKGFISNVENNRTSPSIATLESIANSLKVPLPYLLLHQTQRMQVVRKADRVQTTMPGIDNLKVELLCDRRDMRMMICEMPPGGTTGANTHIGEECHVVISGKILIEQAEDREILEQGDSFSWNASVPHTVTNIGDVPAVVLISVYKEIHLDDVK
ncbi:cupin domain-containing protein [Paenibacillus taiwanensis]|uniref:cupin domain-containing protein n=1 Tax=Paenibacillus taiwanensis TaxID=401638 RepID=UPI00041A9C48|nr:cupin domain-containing protein [Paenibacillus taiwanensis]